MQRKRWMTNSIQFVFVSNWCCFSLWYEVREPSTDDFDHSLHRSKSQFIFLFFYIHVLLIMINKHVTSASMNPVRTLGPAIAANYSWSSQRKTKNTVKRSFRRWSVTKNFKSILTVTIFLSHVYNISSNDISIKLWMFFLSKSKIALAFFQRSRTDFFFLRKT